MVTASRRVSYLQETLDSYAKERVWAHDGLALVIVDVDNSSNLSIAYRLPKRTLEGCDGPDVEGVPSCKTRQSTLDITSALLECAHHTSGWVVLVEDDTTLCSGALDDLVTTLATLDGTAMAKFSPFSAGMSIPASKARAYVDYSLTRLHTHPYDVTRVEDWDPTGRVYTHPRSLFQHIGHVSTQEYRNSEEFRALYAGMRDYECGRALI
jgi:hypothetical protein